MSITKRYCNIKEVAEYTGLPVKTLYDWASQGTIPSIKIRRRVLFDIKDIDRLMARLKRDLDDPDTKAKKILGEYGEGI